MENLKRLIREVPDYPKPGILFYDITTLLKDAGGLKAVIDGLTESAKDLGVQQVVGIEARGFIFGPCIARALGVGFVPIRKPKKLPSKYETVTYDLEYGSDQIAVHSDAIEPGQKVLIVDDLLATGGTAAAAVKLVQKLGGEVAALNFVVELDFLDGRKRLPGLRVDSLVHYDS
jgi:adenine phosphoribosyltransferase